MLAFTVQFSRYGRNPAYSAPIQGPFGAAAEVSALSEAAAPSGPNSVLGSSTPASSSFSGFQGEDAY